MMDSSASATLPESRVGPNWFSSNRTTADILESSLFTLILCTWTVLHLNIPAPGDSAWTLFQRKLKWMVVTLIAPEFTCSIALRQWVDSRAMKAEMKDLNLPWTIAHSFYASMGGYVLHHDQTKVPLLPPEIISLLKSTPVNESERFQLAPIQKEDIKDRNKVSGIAKIITAIQILWLVIQCITRAANGLPIAPLEISTVAFAVCTLFAYGFWWEKPVDVKMSTPVIYERGLPECLRRDSRGWKDRKNRERVKMTTRIITRGSQKSMFLNLTLPFFTFSTLFSTLHLLSWGFDFASRGEKLLWRISSLVATFMPLAIAGFLQLASIWDPAVHHRSQKIAESPELAALVILFYFLSVTAYISARLALLAEVFYSLKSMPSGIYYTIPWTRYIPHL